MPEGAAYRIESGHTRRVYGARRVKQDIQRDAHTLVVQHIVDVPSTIAPSHHDWAYDLRRGRLSIYGGLLRFLELLHRKGVALETALLIPAWIESFIRDVWQAPAPSPLQLMRTDEQDKAA